jgi:putative membrane protein
MRRSARTRRLAIALALPLSLASIGAPLTALPALAAEPAPSESFAQRSLKAGRILASLARLAAERADDPDVRGFASVLLRDLGARNDRLARIVREEGVRDVMEIAPLSAQQIPERTREFQRLRARGGAALDKQFLRAVIVSYENAIRGYEAEVRGSNDDVRALAEDSLPQLKRQLSEARQLLRDAEERGR